ncbi:MAG: hypothetical protein U0736_22900 [Gemmataceae bacterium]
MTYEQALAFWYAQVNFEQRTPDAGDLKLDRMRALLAAVGDPHLRLRVVHIAGSKGKGSTAAMLAAVLGRAGYRTGLFTSPHLCHVEERFQIDGQPITRDALTARYRRRVGLLPRQSADLLRAGDRRRLPAHCPQRGRGDGPGSRPGRAARLDQRVPA